MIRNFVEDIKKARDNKAYLSALALALTMPDICGKIEYHKTSGMDDRDKYISWFNKWVYKYFEIPKSNNFDWNKYDELVKFNGDVCYKLRCAFLHSGNPLNNYKNDKGIRIDRFSLCICDGDWQIGDSHICSFSNEGIKETQRKFNIDNLLKMFILGIEDYLEQNGDNSDMYGTIKIEKI